MMHSLNISQCPITLREIASKVCTLSVFLIPSSPVQGFSQNASHVKSIIIEQPIVGRS